MKASGWHGQNFQSVLHWLYGLAHRTISCKCQSILGKASVRLKCWPGQIGVLSSNRTWAAEAGRKGKSPRRRPERRRRLAQGARLLGAALAGMAAGRRPAHGAQLRRAPVARAARVAQHRLARGPLAPLRRVCARPHTCLFTGKQAAGHGPGGQRPRGALGARARRQLPANRISILQLTVNCLWTVRSCKRGVEVAAARHGEHFVQAQLRERRRRATSVSNKIEI